MAILAPRTCSIPPRLARVCLTVSVLVLAACGGGGGDDAGGEPAASVPSGASATASGSPPAVTSPSTEVSDATSGTTGSPDVAPTPPQSAQPDGDTPMRVNTSTVHAQVRPALAMLRDGGQVVVWQSSQGADEAGPADLVAQRFDPQGSRLGGEIVVGAFQPVGDGAPSVAALADGGFVVTWSTAAGTTLLGGLLREAADRLARRFDASGAPVGPAFRVNQVATPPGGASQVTALAGGGFVITWPSYEASVPTTTIHTQLYDASGAPVGGEARVSDLNAGPSAATVGLADGGHAVMWSSQDSEIRPIAMVRLQRFDRDGGPVGGAVQVNTSVLGAHPTLALAASPDGGLAAAWATAGSDSLHVQRLDAQGARLGGEVEVARSLTGVPMLDPRLTPLAGGAFAVSWVSLVPASEGREQQVLLQRLDANGALAGERQVVSRTAAPEARPRHAVAAAGEGLAFAWPAWQVETGWDVFSRRVAVP